MPDGRKKPNKEAFIYVRVPLETVLTNRKFKFNRKNNDSKSNYSNGVDSIVTSH